MHVSTPSNYINMYTTESKGKDNENYAIKNVLACVCMIQTWLIQMCVCAQELSTQ